MSILVTGANGFVGRALCVELVNRGYSVRAGMRDVSQAIVGGGIAVQIPNMDSSDQWAEILLGVDTIIHLAARVHVMRDQALNPLDEFRRANVLGMDNLAHAAVACGVRRLIFLSSIKVSGEGTRIDQQFTEMDLPSPKDPYGISKYEAELTLQAISQQSDLEAVIIRPPLIFGPGVKGNFAQMLNILAKGIPLPLASVKNLRSLIYLDNLVDAVIACVSHPAAAGETFLVSDGEDISTPDLMYALGGAMGMPARLYPCPLPVLKAAALISGKAGQYERLVGSLRVNSGKINKMLGWAPPFSLREGLMRTGKQFVLRD